MPRKILIVEDERRIARGLSSRLGVLGYTVSCAHDARSAIDQAKTFRPHLMIMDLCLPGGSGFSVMQHLQDEMDKDMPRTIVITASARPGLRQTALDCGAEGFFTKPYDPLELMKRIRELLPLPPSPTAVSRSSQATAEA